MIHVSHLVKTFGGIVAVDDISFEVREGEIFGFLGPNGAGKTTTINILCTLLRPTSGDATLNGLDVTARPHDVRQSIGIIFQDPSLDEKLTATDNLVFHAFIYGIPAPERTRRIEKFLKMVDLFDRRNDIVKKFSGGMKRRLEIARGLLHEPRVLFLDEPTIGLDPQTRAYIWEHIQKIREKNKTTIFLTTHHMEEAEICDRVAIIDHGKIVALDSPSNLKKQLGGDVVYVRSENPSQTVKDIQIHFNLTPHILDGWIEVEVPHSKSFLSDLFRKWGEQILEIDIRRPTLEDVFLKLTGRALRDATDQPISSERMVERARR